MVTFCISLIALVLGYLLYGRFVDSVFGLALTTGCPLLLPWPMGLTALCFLTGRCL